MDTTITKKLYNAGFRYDKSSPKSLEQQITEFCDNYASDHCEDRCRVDDLEEEYHDRNEEPG